MSFFKVLSGILLSLFLRPPTIEKLVTITIDEVCATCFQPTVLAPTQLMTASPLVHLKPMRTGTSSFAGGPPLDDSWPSFITTLMSCRLWLIGVYASVRLPNASSFTIPAVDWISWALLFGFVMLLVLCGCCCCYCSENFSLSGSSRAPQLQMKTIVKRIGNLFDKPARQLRTGATIFESFTPCLGEYVGWTWIFVNALAELIWAVLRHPVYREICREIFQLVAIFLFALAIGIKTLVEKTVLLFRDAYLASEPSRIRHACRLEYRQQASLDLSLVEDFSPSCLEASPEVFHLRDKLVRSKSRFTEERSHKVIQEELRVARKLQPSSNLGDQAHRGLSCVRKPPLVKGSAFGRLSVDFSVTRSTTSKVTSLASAPRALARGPAAGGNRDVRNAQWETKQARDRIVTLEAENGRLRGLLAAPGISSDLVMFDPVSQPTPSVLPSFDVPPTFPLDCLPSPSRPAPASAPIEVPMAAPSTNPSTYDTLSPLLLASLAPATASAHTIGSNVASLAATTPPVLASGLPGPAAAPFGLAPTGFAAAPIEPVAAAPAGLVPAVPSSSGPGLLATPAGSAAPAAPSFAPAGSVPAALSTAAPAPSAVPASPPDTAASALLPSAPSSSVDTAPGSSAAAPDTVAPAPLIPAPLPAAISARRRLTPRLLPRGRIAPPPARDPSPGAPKPGDIPLAIPFNHFSSPLRPAPALAPIKVLMAAPSTDSSAYSTLPPLLPANLAPATASAHTIGSNVASLAATAAPVLASGLPRPAAAPFGLAPIGFAAAPIEPVAAAPAGLMPAVPSGSGSGPLATTAGSAAPAAPSFAPAGPVPASPPDTAASALLSSAPSSSVDTAPGSFAAAPAPAPLIPAPLPAAISARRRLVPRLLPRGRIAPPPARDPPPGAPKPDDVPLTIPLNHFSSPLRPAPALAPIEVPMAAPSTNPSAYGTLPPLLPTSLAPVTASAHTIGPNSASSFLAATAAPAAPAPALGISGPAAGPIEPVAAAPAAPPFAPAGPMPAAPVLVSGFSGPAAATFGLAPVPGPGPFIPDPFIPDPFISDPFMLGTLIPATSPYRRPAPRLPRGRIAPLPSSGKRRCFLPPPLPPPARDPSPGEPAPGSLAPAPGHFAPAPSPLAPAPGPLMPAPGPSALGPLAPRPAARLPCDRFLPPPPPPLPPARGPSPGLPKPDDAEPQWAASPAAILDQITQARKDIEDARKATGPDADGESGQPPPADVAPALPANKSSEDLLAPAPCPLALAPTPSAPGPVAPALSTLGPLAPAPLAPAPVSGPGPFVPGSVPAAATSPRRRLAPRLPRHRFLPPPPLPPPPPPLAWGPSPGLPKPDDNAEPQWAASPAAILGQIAQARKDIEDARKAVRPDADGESADAAPAPPADESSEESEEE
ncbi:hypothetical protein V2W45_1349614 [Cenococcum geophilum]